MRTSPAIHGRIAAATIALAAVVALGIFMAVGAASAGDAARRAPRSTHIGIAPADFVVLELIDETTAPKFVRVNSDGTRDTAAFTVPEGRAFVVTGYDALGQWASIGDYLTVRFWVKDTESGDRSVVLAQAFDAVGAGGSGNASFSAGGAHAALTSGVLLGAGTVVEADVIRTTRPDNSFTALSEFGKYHISVRGYLTTVD